MACTWESFISHLTVGSGGLIGTGSPSAKGVWQKRVNLVWTLAQRP